MDHTERAMGAVGQFIDVAFHIIIVIAVAVAFGLDPNDMDDAIGAHGRSRSFVLEFLAACTALSLLGPRSSTTPVLCVVAMTLWADRFVFASCDAPTELQVKAVKRTLSRFLHPDKGGAAILFRQLEKASSQAMGGGSLACARPGSPIAALAEAQQNDPAVNQCACDLMDPRVAMLEEAAVAGACTCAIEDWLCGVAIARRHADLYGCSFASGAAALHGIGNATLHGLAGGALVEAISFADWAREHPEWPLPQLVGAEGEPSGAALSAHCLLPPLLVLLLYLPLLGLRDWLVSSLRQLASLPLEFLRLALLPVTILLPPSLDADLDRAVDETEPPPPAPAFAVRRAPTLAHTRRQLAGLADFSGGRSFEGWEVSEHAAMLIAVSEARRLGGQPPSR